MQDALYHEGIAMGHPLSQQSLDLTARLLRLHYCEHDLGMFLKYLSKDITWIGTGENEFSMNYDEIVSFFNASAQSGAVPACRITEEEYTVMFVTGDTCGITGRCRISTTEESEMILSVRQRVTFVFRMEQDGLKVIHIHASNPYQDMKPGEYFPTEVGQKNYEYMKQLISQQTRQLNILIDNLPGGLKLSRQDDGYSFTYVSPELCAMLGYTLDEFMEYSGGTAAGACYEEDREEAVADSIRCFNEGDSYTCEYRMKKKDGTLIWVRDYGKKFISDTGEKLINSVIEDITEKKLKELEIEASFNSLPGGMLRFLLDDPMTVLSVNKTYDEMLGQTDSSRKTSLQECMFPEDFVPLRGIMRQQHEHNGKLSGTFRYSRPDGSVSWFRLRGTKLGEKDGTPCYLGLITDITDEQIMKRKLEEEQEKYRLAMKNTPDIMFQYDIPKDVFTSFENSTDDDGKKIIITLERYSKLLYDESLAIIHPDDIENTLKLLKAGEFTHQEIRLKFPEDKVGTYRWCVIQGTAVYDADGNTLRTIGTIRDISEQKQQQELQTRLEEICNFTISSDYDSISLIDTYTEAFEVYTSTSDSQSPSLNVASTPRATKEYRDLIAQEDLEAYDRNMSITGLLEKIDMKSPSQRTFRYRLRSGQQYRWKESKCMPFSSDSRKIILSIRDIHDDMLKQLQEKELEDQTKQILRNALATAENASHAKSSFLSRISHEIRTPLNAIIGMSTLASSYLDDEAKIENYIGKILTSSKHLLSLINDVLDMSKIESGKLQISRVPFKLDSITNEIRSIIYPQTEARNQSLEIYTDVIHEHLVGDSLRLAQILINLLSNSVKYTPKGGAVRLEIIEYPERFSNTTRFSFKVQDSGIGMSAEFQKKLFQPFEQERNDTGGTGLGMAITKNLVTMMNGEISVESEIGNGSCFIVSLPFQLDLNVDTPQYKNKRMQTLKVLIADDDRVTCEHTQLILNRIGVSGEWVLSGAEAVEKVNTAYLKKDLYDVVFIDWRMPDMDGVETTRQIRKIVGPDPLIIIISAYDWTEIEEQAREAGANAFIPKPMFQSNLYNTLLAVTGSEQQEILTQGHAVTKDFRGRRFLLVEDNELNLEIAQEMLGQTGADIDTAGNGKDALERFRQSPSGFYDVILMDIQMPEMDGYEATRAIREAGRPDSDSVLIIAMTANAFAEDITAALRAGMNAHISKPIDMNLLVTTISKQLGEEHGKWYHA